jgi:calcineurin-like phosphoesterase family protein
MDYFSSDWHLGHYNIMRVANRPFSSVEEMDNTIMDNMITPLKKGDNIYFIGDIGYNKETIEEALKRIHKKKINFFWILGNHDMKFPLGEFEQYCHTITPSLIIKREHTVIHLNHFPMMTWEKSFYNSFHLYGHLHTNSVELEEVEKRQTGKAFNVNLEFNDYKPYNLHDIFEIMSKKGDNWDYELLKKERGDGFLEVKRGRYDK